MARHILSLLILLPYLTACCEEEIVRDNELINRWVYGIMEEHYLWGDTMPEDWETNVKSHPESFFTRLLYNREDDFDLNDLYSRIIYVGDENHYPARDENNEYALEIPDYQFGITARFYGLAESFCQVIMVVPGSPADQKGIKRGDCFSMVNGQRIENGSQLSRLLSDYSRLSIEFFYPEVKTVALSKTYYYDDPVYMDTVYKLQPYTGYLVYNHFSDGDNDKYYTRLRQVFARFRDEQVENVVIDLRFNGGGELTAARKLASLLAPKEDLGKEYLYKERRSSFGDPDRFESETLLNVGAYNCDLKGVYFITNANTASASELVIHCLRPLYKSKGLKFVHAGEQTEGKNVGGMWFANSLYEWELYPITLRVHNVDKVSGYESGLVPDITVSEYDTGDIRQTDEGRIYTPIGQLGNIAEELILRRVMDDIYGIGGWQGLAGNDEAADPDPADPELPAGRMGAAPTAVHTSTTIRYRPLIER